MSANNIQDYLNQLKKVEGIYFDTTQSDTAEFESYYLSVRKSENRLLSDEEVANLPLIKNYQHTKEWEKRTSSAKRLAKYFSDSNSGNVLDLGCGNGWFTAILAKNNKHEVVGMDVNLTELKQAARVFQKPNLSFIYGDIFYSQFPENSFDYITINAVIQYFQNLKLLIIKLFEFLKPGGELHFIDSPLYKKEELAGAKQRTVAYYASKGFPEMSKYYFHHSWSEISIFEPEMLYNGKSKSKFYRLFQKPDMPFPWIKIIKKDG